MVVCGAKLWNRDKTCRAHALKGKKRCRIHGGLSSGAKTPEGRQRIKEARLKHGLRSAAHTQKVRLIREELREAKAFIKSI